jgi:hypothetical protein
VVDTGAVGDSIGRPVGFRWAPPREAEAGPHVRLLRRHSARRVDRAARQAAATPSLAANSNFMNITLVDYDPVEAAATLNTWLTEFDSTALWLKRRNVSEYSKLLEVQRQSRMERLKDAELKLEGFRTRTITCPPKPRSSRRGSSRRAIPSSARTSTKSSRRAI